MCHVSLTPSFILNTNFVMDSILSIVDLLCPIRELFQIEESSVCNGIHHYYAKPLYEAIFNGIASPNRICNELLHLCRPNSEEK